MKTPLPVILKFESRQPQPACIWVNHVGVAETIITRTWDETPTGCKLCPGHECGEYHGTCQVTASSIIPPAECGLYVLPAPALTRAAR